MSATCHCEGKTRYLLPQCLVPAHFWLQTTGLLISDKQKNHYLWSENHYHSHAWNACQTLVWSDPNYCLTSKLCNSLHQTVCWITVSHAERVLPLPVAQFSFLSCTCMSLMLLFHFIAPLVTWLAHSYLSNRCPWIQNMYSNAGLPRKGRGANWAVCTWPLWQGMKLHD